MLVLNIEKPNNIGSVLMEHGVKTVFAFVGTFSVILFVTIFMSRRRSNKSIDLMDLVFLHLDVVVIIAVVVAFAFNLYTYSTNSIAQNISRIVFDENTKMYKIGLVNYYSNKLKEQDIPADVISYKLIDKEKHYILQLFCNKISIGFIDLDTKFEIVNRRKLSEITRFIDSH